MSREDVLWLIHHDSVSLPLICPCDTANSSRKKTHWSAEELHCTIWGAENSGTTRTFNKLVVMVNGLMVESSHPLLAPLPLSQKPSNANLLTGYDIITLMPVRLILPLATVSLRAFFGTPPSWWTGPLDTIGHLV